MRDRLRTKHLVSGFIGVLSMVVMVCALLVGARPVTTHAAALTTTLSACTESELDAAVANGGAIIVACNSPIKLSSQMTVPAGVTVSLDGTGYSASISGNYSTRLFDVEGGSLTLTNLTLTAGSVNGTNNSPIRGGAIFVGSGAVTLNGVTVSASGSAGQDGASGLRGSDGLSGTNGTPGSGGEWAEGGAIYNASGRLTINNSTFGQNFVIAGSGGDGGSGGNGANGGQGGSGADGGTGGFGLGGAIYNDTAGTLTIAGSTFTGNSATAGYGGHGGNSGSGGEGTFGAWGANGSDGAPVPSGQDGDGQPGASGGNGGDGGPGGQTGAYVGNAGSSGAGQGGAIYNAGAMKVVSSTFTGNRITSVTGVAGGSTGYEGGGGSGGPGGVGGNGSDGSGGNSIGGAGGWGGNGGSGGQGATGPTPGGNGGNGGEADGGAIYTVTPATVTGDTFTNNSATGGPGGIGGHGAGGGAAGIPGNGGTGGNGGDGVGTGAGGVGGNGGSGGNAGAPGNGTNGGPGGNGGSARGGAVYAPTGTTLACSTFNGNTVSGGYHGSGGPAGGAGGTGLLGGGAGFGGSGGMNGDGTSAADGQPGISGSGSSAATAGSDGRPGSDGASAGADVYGLNAGSGGCVTVAPSSLTVYAKVGTTGASQTVTLTNAGGSPISISTVTLGGANASLFVKQSDTCSNTSLAGGSSCAVAVALQPATVGAYAATLSFVDIAPDSPQTVALTGYGLIPHVSLATKTAGVGKTYALTGSGFAPSETVQVTWDTASGVVIGRAQADAQGNVTIQITIPTAKYGPHSIFATGQTSMLGATSQVVVVPANAG